MIEAQDLRIGNFIQSGKGIYKAISISHHEGETDLITVANDGLVIAYACIYKPIPITEEWLLKFGAVKYNGNRFYLDIKDTLQLFWNIGYDYFICEFSSRSTHVCYFNDIKYIHQLQNLYFALTQKELIFNG